MSTNDSIPLTPEVSHSNVVTIYDMTNTISKITYVTGAFLSFASKRSCEDCPVWAATVTR